MSPKVKHVPRITLPSIIANGTVKPTSDSSDEMLGASAPPPTSTSPSNPFNIPASVVTKKTVPSVPLPLAPLPSKKLTPPGPYVKGQVGHIFFSLGRIWSYTDIPPGHSLIVSKFWKPFQFEGSAGKFVLINPFDNKWSSPETFNKWCECVEHGDLNELDLTKYRLVVVRFRSKFKLSCSLRKTSWKDETYPIKVEDEPQEEEDE